MSYEPKVVIFITVKTSEQPVLQVLGVKRKPSACVCTSNKGIFPSQCVVHVLLHGGGEDSVHRLQQELGRDLSQSVQQHL